MALEIKTMEERKNDLIKLGKDHGGKLTYEELAEELKGLDVDADSLDDLYNSLVENNIEVVNEDGTSDKEEDVLSPEDIEVEDLTMSKDVKINDPVRMYLK